MAISKTLFGSTVSVPERKEKGWGVQVTNILTSLIDGIAGAVVKVGSAYIAAWSTADSTLASAATLTPTATMHRVQGNGGAVVLDGTTAIADGSVDGQQLVLEGADATNTVEITDGANVDLNGDVTLALGQCIRLAWNETRSVWVEVARNH